jgi:hypothetical protein
MRTVRVLACILIALLGQAATVRADVGPCSCSGCSCGEAATVSVDTGALTSQVTLSVCVSGGCGITIKNVLNGRAACVSADGATCTYHCHPCDDRTWGQVTSCEHICCGCDECP